MMPRLRVDQGTVNLHYTDWGTSPNAVVLLHGYPFSSGLWRPQIEALSSDYRVIAPDFRGFGASDPSPKLYSMAQLADDVAELLDTLKISRAVIAGLSMGGYVAFEFYRRYHSRSVALILADTKPDADSPEAAASRVAMAERVSVEGCQAVVDELLPRLLAPETRSQAPQVEIALREMMASASPDAIEAALMAMANRTDYRSLLRHIAVPVLVVAGAEDTLTPPAATRAWAQQIPGVRTEFIAAAGHVSNLEQPERFNALLREFLAAATAKPSPTTPAEDAV